MCVASVKTQTGVNVIGGQGALEGAGLLGLHGARGAAGDVAGVRVRPAVGGQRPLGRGAVQTDGRLAGARRRACTQAARDPVQFLGKVSTETFMTEARRTCKT